MPGKKVWRGEGHEAGYVTGNRAFNNTFITVTAPPQSTVGIQDSTASFGVSAVSGYLGSAAAGPAIVCQWQSAPAGSLNFTNILGATDFNYTPTPLTLAQNGARFRATLTTAGFVTNTPFATLTVIPDTHTPVPVAVRGTTQGGGMSRMV